MLLYYHSWMFYNHFIVILYHFLVLTYWHSAKCQLLFLHVSYIAGNQYQTESKRSGTFCGFFMNPKTSTGPKKHLGGALRGAQPTRARLEAQAGPGGLCPPWVPPEPPLYSINTPKIPETLGESTKINSSRCKFQNHQIQSRHHHGGVHHVHWCLSDDAWVVLCRPTGP